MIRTLTRVESPGSPSSSPPSAAALKSSPTASSTCWRASQRGQRSTNGVGSTGESVSAERTSFCEGRQHREADAGHLRTNNFDDARRARAEERIYTHGYQSAERWRTLRERWSGTHTHSQREVRWFRSTMRLPRKLTRSPSGY
eukprot:15455950-Alexandrium_andersonii.AAC.1